MSDEDLRAELAELRSERDALLAERERTAPLVAAARAYVEAVRNNAAAEDAWDPVNVRGSHRARVSRARNAVVDAHEALLAVARDARSGGAK